MRVGWLAADAGGRGPQELSPAAPPLGSSQKAQPCHHPRIFTINLLPVGFRHIMSGIEVAGLVFGLVPIVVEILKSYKDTRDRLRSFARHAQVVQDVQLRYRVAATNFGNDCQLLLKSVVEDRRELVQMIDDPTHNAWYDSDLEERLRRFLGRDCDVFEQVVLRIRDVLRQTATQLSHLDKTLLQPQNDSRATLNRLYVAFDVACRENTYRRALEDLDQWNTKLCRLRAQRYKLQKQRTHHSEDITHRRVPRRYSEIQTASQKLHESLRDSWSCTNVSHVEHQAKLCLDAEAEAGSAKLDMVIACRRRTPTNELGTGHRSSTEPPIWLQVQSVTTNQTSSRSTLQPAPILESLSTSLLDHPQPQQLANSSPSSGSVFQKVKKSLKRVRFDTPSNDSGLSRNPPRKFAPSHNSDQSAAVTFAMLNLRSLKSTSFCCHLSQACLSTACNDISLGYLESLEASDSFKLIFYDASRKAETSLNRDIAKKHAYSIRTKLAEFQTLHQLTLAYKLATAVLQYHSTSWLSQHWSLEDVSYFTDETSLDVTAGAADIDLAQDLRTLHLSTRFPLEPPSPQDLPPIDLDDLSYIYGIRNLTLAGLGVALLEIGIGKEIGAADLDDSMSVPHRIIEARKLLRKEPPVLAKLGRRYMKMIQKCIDCDFSCGEDLANESLRSAVYTTVICTLESMIADWNKFIAA